MADDPQPVGLIYARQSILRKRKGPKGDDIIVEDERLSVDRQVDGARKLAQEQGIAHSPGALRGPGQVCLRPHRPSTTGGRRCSRPSGVASEASPVRFILNGADADRLYRQPMDREQFMLHAAAYGVEAIITGTGVERIGQPDDRFMGDLKVLLSRRESAVIARRVKDKQHDKARTGEWLGGPPPFGYRRVAPASDVNGRPIGVSKLVIDKAEAGVVREIAKRLLSGQSARSIAEDLNRRDLLLRGKKGNRTAWLSGYMIRYITSPSLAGLIRYEGTLYKGHWRGIVSWEDHERLLALAQVRREDWHQAQGRVRRGEPSGRSTPTKWPLSGLLRCHRCQGVLTTSATRRKQWVYRCPPAGNGGCGCTSVNAAKAEVALVEQVAAHIDSPAFAKAVERVVRRTGDSPLAAVSQQLAEDRAYLGTLADMLGDRALTPDEYARARARVDERIRQNEATLAQSHPSAAALGLAGRGSEIIDLWPEWTVSERRTCSGPSCGSSR